MIKKWEDSKKTIHSGDFHGSQNDYDVIDCLECGFKHVVPIPTASFLEDYYKNNFVNNRPEGFFKKIEEDEAWWKISYAEKYDMFEKHINKSHPSILDIGSGLGYFLKDGKERGWQVTGIDPSIESCEYSKSIGVDVVNEYLDEHNYGNLGKFDVVHMHNVIEHLPDPQQMINIALKLLNPNGLICIVSPNDYNPLQLAFVKANNKNKWWIVTPEHINYFSFSSIRKLLEKQGLNILEQTASYPLELFLLMGEDYVSDQMIGRKIHEKRKMLEMALMDTGKEEMRRSLYHNFSELGLGREFTLVAQVKIKHD
jgi:2-polyprenyl-3-methyl-5-hydroxy-6-metoxy-1,4-benzoquinol methylase